MQQRGESGDGSQPPYTDQVPQYVQGPYSGQQALYGGQQVPQPYQPTQPYQPPQTPKKKTGSKIAGFGCLGIVAIFVIAIIATAVGGTKSGSTTAAVAPATAAAATTAAKAAAAPAAAAPATSKAPAATPQQVVFRCTGNAPDGVDITYGAEGTNDSASSLPFSVTVSLDNSAQYYNVTAQLQGDGQVACSTVVDWDGQSVTQSGSADGGYNLASAEVCSDFMGGWQAC